MERFARGGEETIDHLFGGEAARCAGGVEFGLGLRGRFIASLVGVGIKDEPAHVVGVIATADQLTGEPAE